MTAPNQETTIFDNSSYLREASYNREAKSLHVTFSDGSQYTYSAVPSEIWSRLQHAPSAGSFFHRQIKGRFNVEPKNS